MTYRSLILLTNSTLSHSSYYHEYPDATTPVATLLQYNGKHITDGSCKLADFGLSRKILPGEIVQEICGTPEYTGKENYSLNPMHKQLKRCSLYYFDTRSFKVKLL